MSDFERLVTELQAEVVNKQAVIRGAEQRISALRTIEHDLRNEIAVLQAELAKLKPQYEIMLKGVQRFHDWMEQDRV